MQGLLAGRQFEWINVKVNYNYRKPLERILGKIVLCLCKSERLSVFVSCPLSSYVFDLSHILLNV